MLRPLAYITITSQTTGKEIVFNFVHEFSTSESFEHLTDVAKITLPRKLSQSGLPIFTGTNPIFRRKDKIKIESGYFPNRETLFEGFITKVSANIPIQMECEDYMFVMKTFNITYPIKRGLVTLSKKGKPLKHPKVTSDNISLSQLVGNIWHEGEILDLFDDITYEIVDDIPLGQMRFNNVTPAKIFDRLRTDCGLYTYFIGKKLYIGFANDAVSTVEREYKMEEVCINSNELNYQDTEDVTIKVKCVGMMQDNTKVEVEFGDPEGEQRTYHFYNISDKSKLQKIAEERVKAYKYTGFKGTFETFGQPVLHHGDRLKMSSTKLPERNGTYLVKAVKRTFSVTGGYRQSFELGFKVE